MPKFDDSHAPLAEEDRSAVNRGKFGKLLCHFDVFVVVDDGFKNRCCDAPYGSLNLIFRVVSERFISAYDSVQGW